MFKRIISLTLLIIAINLNAAQKNEMKVKLPSTEVLQERFEFNPDIKNSGMFDHLANKELTLDQINDVIFTTIYFLLRSSSIQPNKELYKHIIGNFYKLILKDNKEMLVNARAKLKQTTKAFCSQDDLKKVYAELFDAEDLDFILEQLAEFAKGL